MKTVKSIATRGFLVMVFTLMAMTAIDMVGNGAVFGTKVVQAETTLKIPKNAKKKEAKAAKKLKKFYVISYKWKNGKLVKLHLAGGPKKINLSAFTSLTDLKLGGQIVKGSGYFSSNITNLDLSKNKKLKNLFIGEDDYDKDCHLKKINISKCKNLRTLKISGTKKLKKIDLSKNSKLKTIELLDTDNLSNLSLPKSTALKKLSVQSKKLTKLDLTKYKQLSYLALNYGNLWYDDNRLTSLNLSGLTSLKEIKIGSTKLEKLDLSGLKSLSKITFEAVDYDDYVGSLTILKQVDLSNCSSLRLENIKFEGSGDINTTFLYNGLLYKYVEYLEDKWCIDSNTTDK